jgi:hypothetical protein
MESLQVNIDDPGRSESAVAHFIVCAAAAAIAITIRPIQSSRRQSLPSSVLEACEGFETGATKAMMRDSSMCA